MNVRSFFLLIIIFLVSSCSTMNQDPTAGWSAKKLFEEAKNSMYVGNYTQASSYLETLEARYPFGQYALQAQFEMAYSYYKSEQFDEAIITLDRFIKEHPRNPRIDYAYYLRGLSYFKSGTTFFESFVPRDLSTRDQASVQSAFDNFETIIRRFSSSQYFQDSRQRMIFLRNEMSRHDLKIAQYYARRNAHVAVINRVKNMLDRFDGAPSIPDGLALMAESYKQLNMAVEADNTIKIIKQNYPDHPALQQFQQASNASPQPLDSTN